jgi:peptidoglycan hydrolase-like amidase
MNRELKKSTMLKILVLIVYFFTCTFQTVYSRTLYEIEKEIEQKKTELETADKEIVGAETEIGDLRLRAEDIKSKRDQVNAQVEINKKEAEIIQKKLNDLVNKQGLWELEREHRVMVQDGLVLESYLHWKQVNQAREILASKGENILKMATYRSTIAKHEQDNIKRLNSELEVLETEIGSFAKTKQDFEIRITDLANQSAKMLAEVAEIDRKINANQNDISNYRAKKGELQSQIDQLTAEQKAMQEAEARFLGTPTNGGSKPLKPGDLYFQGIGRELYQGHGVGMSQFGALGAALKGWDYKKIVEFYYPGAKVQTYTTRNTLNVAGYGNMSVEDYVAGAGEVPDFACEDLEMEFDPKNVWKCWPKEAIKAQAVAFRTYGLYKTMDGSSICTTAHCQVYKGGENKRWAAEETENQVLLYEGIPIGAFYSSDNHNGWGTANNDTVWSDFTGVGVAKNYLRAVNDTAIAFHFSYTDWTWRTNGYSIDQIEEMFGWGMTSPKASVKHKEFLQANYSQIGDLKTLDFVRDPSGRVSRVKVIGDKGSFFMAGWLFKSIWNIWVGNEKPSGQEDYIFSLTYYYVKKD